MLEKVILLIFDGLGDRPIEDFRGLTPLECANTKNLDRIAQSAECGMMHTLGRGLRPGSDTSHLAILGYDPKKYYCGRGPIEVTGIGLELQQGDVALRGNFGTVDDNMVITDRRAGRILDVQPLTDALDGLEIDNVRFIVKPGTAHRAGVIMRGINLSSAITNADPHEINLSVQTVQPTDDTPDARRTADVLNRFLAKSHEILKQHQLNIKREKKGKLAANYLLVRGAGQYNNVPGFEEHYGLSACCIAGAGLYKGIGAFLGMKVLTVPGATGLPNTNVEAKFRAAREQLDSFDFVFVHVKGADSLGEDGDFEGKKAFIEKADRAISILTDLTKNTLLVVTADHSTPCELNTHSADPVPIMICGEGVRVDKVSSFGERACTDGGLGFIKGKHIMPFILNLMGRSPLIGA